MIVPRSRLLGAILVALYLICWVDSQAVAYRRNVTLYHDADSKSSTHLLTLKYNNLLFWREDVLKSVGGWQLETATLVQEAIDELSSVIHNYLTLRKYPPEMVAGDSVGEMPAELRDKPISCSQAVASFVQSAYSFIGRPHYDLDKASHPSESAQDYHALISAFTKADMPILSLGNTRLAQHFAQLENPVKVIGSVIERYKPDHSTSSGVHADGDPLGDHGYASRYPALLGARGSDLRTTFIVYQTRFANTGGTTALRILYDILSELFSPFSASSSVLLCDETNHLSRQCSAPPDSAVVITGEWCHEVLRDHGLEYHRGRGVQYHLGFHHYRDMCAGHIAMTDSQYLHTYLGPRTLSAYYLSCPMTPTVESAFAGLLRPYDPHDVPTHSRGVAKEDLVVIDPDYSKEYRPDTSINIDLPAGVRVVFAEDIPHEEMPLLLQRAKVVVDLAVPGPERLIGEGTLSGAIPIISDRWNGASVIDFPGVLRVDATDGKNISDVITAALKSYPDRVHSPRNGEFLKYIVSLRERTHNTVEIVASSASIHFLLSPRTRQEERMAVFQVLALLHVFPLASVDLLVGDSVWFTRHNYPFIQVLREAGYIREDIMEPLEAEEVSIAGAVTRGGLDRPPTWGKSQGESWAQADTHHDNGSGNKAHVAIKSRRTARSAIQEQISSQTSVEGPGGPRASTLGDTEITPGWGAVLVAVDPGIVLSDARSLLEVANTVMSQEEKVGQREEEKTLHSSFGDVTVASPRMSLNNVAASSWYERIYGHTRPSHTVDPASRQKEENADTIYALHFLLQCPSVRSSSRRFTEEEEEGDDDESARLTVVDGVTQIPAWLLLQSHYCHHL